MEGFVFFNQIRHLIRPFCNEFRASSCEDKAHCEHKQGAEIALELRNNLDLGQNWGVHGFLVNLALLCHLVFLWVEDRALVVSEPPYHPLGK